MYLKKVEIQGFKSFGDMVKLEIPSGITVVVGPNGCGKSNIADAMRWVLGEQSARLLRGTKMEDVIFAGTQNRRGLGYAQVSMTLDNSERELPIDYSEVVITRRVYRSGESEYLLNKSPCRLRDIQELLMGTGVGKEGYSIIGQGQIDEVLSSKPEDRRNLFEEAAGIYKYKLRKLEAEKKLEKERENLVRIQDIIMELESRVETLKEQAEQAKKYISIKDKLKITELNIFLFEVDQIEKDIKDLTNSYDILKSDYESNNDKLKSAKQSYDEIRTRLTKLQQIITEVQTEITSISMSIEKHDGSMKLNLEKIRAIDEANKRIQEDNKKRSIKSAEQEAEKRMLETRELKLKDDVLKLKELLEETYKEYKQTDLKATENEREIEVHKEEVFMIMSRISEIKANIEKEGSLAEQLDDRKNKLTEALNIIRSDIQHQDVRMQVLNKEKNSSQKLMLEILSQKEELEKHLAVLKREDETLYVNQRKLEDNYHRASSRYSVLSQMQNEYEGFQKSVKNILKLKGKTPTQWENIYGVVGELITVPKEFEIAIDVALGGSIQHIVTKDEETAKNMIDHIKRNNLGRATFLPISSVKGFSIGVELESLSQEPGVIGLASELIEYNKVYSGIIASILGRVILVDTMENAIGLAKKYRYKYRIVTLEGELLNPGGSITGGNFHKNKENIFSRNREVVELRETIESCKLELNNIQEKKLRLEEKFADTAKQIKALEEQKRTIENQQMECLIKINKVEETLKQAEIQRINIQKEKIQLDTDYERIFIDIGSYEELLDSSQEKLKKIEKNEILIQESIQEIRQKKDKLSNKVTELKVSLSSKEEMLRSINEQVERVKKDMEYYMNENQSYESQLKSSSERKIELEKEIEIIALKIQEEKELLKNKHEKLEQVKKEETQYINKESDMRQEQDRIVERSSILQAEIYSVENKITKANLEKENIYKRAWEEYEATYHIAKSFETDLGSIVQMRKIASDYKKQIRELGVINVGAVQEYDETKERYEFLKEHEEDILKAEQTLIHLIEELTSSMEEIFKEQFEKISHNFNIVFTELFGGGQAFLQLTDADNLLESGIEIIAQPPGKKLQNMMLLSGGERALTAIAILFGILRLKPSPFAILDEIEAALDDANVNRFANYLKKLGKQMQFIVITHRKGTMEVADTMYGVTMEEQGVSKILSVKLDEIESYVKANAT